MSGKGYSEYIKAPRIREIIQRDDKDCEEKLANIFALLDNNGEKKNNGEQGENSGSGLRVMEPNVLGASSSAGVEQESTSGKYDKIIDKLSGTDRKMALNLLELIDQYANLSWDPGNFEIIVNNEQIQFSDLRQLVKKVVMTAGTTLPVGITLFIEELIKMNVPISLFRSGDSMQIRGNLLKINRFGNEESSNNENSVPEESNKTTSSEENAPKQVGKRKREIEVEYVDDDDIAVKKVKHDSDVEESFDQPPDKLKGIRRSNKKF